MKRTDHRTPVEARRELSRNGFYPAHAPPGQPTPWKRPRQKAPVYMIAPERRARSTVFHIVPYEYERV